jgi:thymidylate synthase (FAD)
MRHRVFSFAQESTRYCNYSKNKFGKEITFVAPYWYTWNNGSNDRECSMDSEFELTCEEAEKSYLRMISWGATPQQARQILPNCLKTEIIMTGFAKDWKYFLKVRATNEYGVPHPDMVNLANMIKDKIKDKIN